MVQEIQAAKVRLQLLEEFQLRNPDEEKEEKIKALKEQVGQLEGMYKLLNVPTEPTLSQKIQVEAFVRENSTFMAGIPRAHPTPVSKKESQVRKITNPEEDMKEELDINRCQVDVVYLAARLFRIKYRVGISEVHPEWKEGPFHFTKAQLQLIRLLLDALIANVAVRIIILKARQEGITTTLWAFWVFLALTIPHFRVFFIIDKNSHSAEKKQMVIDWLRAAEKNLPWAPHIVGGTSTSNIMLSNGAILHFESAEADNPGSSLNVDVVHTSEEPKWPAGKCSTIKESMFPGVPTQGFSVIIRESTAVGLDAFYQDFKLARKKKSEYKPVFIPWHYSAEYRMPLSIDDERGFYWHNHDADLNDYDQETDTELTEEAYAKKYKLTKEQILWRRFHIKTTFGGSRTSFDQEYPTSPDHAFRKQGFQFFSTMLLGKIERHLKDPIFRGRLYNRSYINPAVPVSYVGIFPELKQDPHGQLYIFEYPIQGEQYFIGGDTAEGIQTVNARGDVITDRTVFVVKNRQGRNVAYLCSRDKPDTLWIDLLLLAVFFNAAYVNVELDKDGITLRSYFLRTGYPFNVVHPGTAPIEDRVWTRTTPPHRRLVLSNIRGLYSQNPDFVPFREHWDEMVSFIQNATTGKPEASPGDHDDIVMADAHSGYCLYFFHPVATPPPTPPLATPVIEEPLDTSGPVVYKLEDTTAIFLPLWK